MRPIFTMSANSSAFAASASRSSLHRRARARARSPRPRRCASRSGTCRSTTATCSRGRSGGSAPSSPASPPASSMARFEITSLTFMFVCVPLPVCHTNSGNSSSSLPARISSAARDDEVGLVVGELAEVAVHERGGLLEDGHAADHRARHAVVADGEVVERALRLGAPVPVVGHLDRAHAVGLGPRRRVAHTNRTYRLGSGFTRTMRLAHVTVDGVAHDGCEEPGRAREHRGLRIGRHVSRSRSMPRTIAFATSAGWRTLIAPRACASPRACRRSPRSSPGVSVSGG